MKKAIEEAKKIVLAELSREELRDAEFVMNVLIERLETMEEEPTTNGWISVKERLPEEKWCYIVYEPNDVDAAYYDKRRWSFLRDDYMCVNVTHWKKLPNPPQEDITT